uniref:Uncharacterized protein n=1 Tax=Lepisosteus oculatus TaxID=7918 RepID=W5MN36_LEPOC
PLSLSVQWSCTGVSSQCFCINPSLSQCSVHVLECPVSLNLYCSLPVESSPSPSTGTVWIGTQDGSVLVHPAAGDIRRCLQSVSLREGVHSITHARGLVIAGLADGTLAFFSRGPDGSWDLQSHAKLSLGPPPVQPIRCCLATGAGLWCGYWNQVFVIDSQSRRVEVC